MRVNIITRANPAQRAESVNWRKIPIALIDWIVSTNAWLQQLKGSSAPTRINRRFCLVGHLRNRATAEDSIDTAAVGKVALNKPQPNSIILVLFATWIVWGFGYQTLFTRLLTDVEGTVISTRDIPYPLAPARYGTEYVFKSPEGRTVSYIAGPTDASLPRSMPVGTYIKKRRWHFSYERNGQPVDQFGIILYLAFLAVAVGCLVWAAKLKRKQLMPRV